MFCSYAHEDEGLRDDLEKHLSALKRTGVITSWHDRRIGPGREWTAKIDCHLNAAQIILLLVSADFLASDYCYDVEMRRAMERHREGAACVIPVILREVDWSDTPFAELQALPRDAKPVTSWANQDEAFADVARGIRQKALAFSGTASSAKSEPSDANPEAQSDSPSGGGRSASLLADATDAGAGVVAPPGLAIPRELGMAGSKQRTPQCSGSPLVDEREGPRVAPEMARLLRETAAAADKTAQNYALLRARLRELQIEHARLRWRLGNDGPEFVAELHRMYGEESEVFLRWANEVARVQRQIETIGDAIEQLNEQLLASDPSVIKVVVELDMARYSDIAGALEHKRGPGAVKELNRQIRDFITGSIRSVGAVVRRTFWKSTGDGAILVFDNALQASQFGESLQETASAFGRGKRSPAEQRHFRVGIATGPVVLETQPEEGADAEAAEMAGMVISNAARLEAACRTGEVLVDHPTWSLFPPDHQALYSDEETVQGKRKELIPAHRRAVVKRASWDKG